MLTLIIEKNLMTDKQTNKKNFLGYGEEGDYSAKDFEVDRKIKSIVETFKLLVSLVVFALLLYGLFHAWHLISAEFNKPNPIEQLKLSKPSALHPDGELAEIFELGGDFTDLQRQLKLEDIRGKVVEWHLPVYDVKRSGDKYTIQTSSSFRGGQPGKLIGTFLRITPRNKDDRQFIEGIKTGDAIKVKGVIDDVTMRNLDINPAILVD